MERYQTLKYSSKSRVDRIVEKFESTSIRHQRQLSNLTMLDLEHNHSIIRANVSSYTYLHLLEAFLTGISIQRDRIKTLAGELNPLTVFSPDTTQANLQNMRTSQSALFREIRVFFWWWHSADKIIWTGEKKSGTIKRVNALVDIFGSEFKAVVEPFRKKAKDFTTARNHLEHILDRLASGVSDLGNLKTTGVKRIFTFAGTEFDISDSQLDLIDGLTEVINKHLDK